LIAIRWLSAFLLIHNALIMLLDIIFIKKVLKHVGNSFDVAHVRVQSLGIITTVLSICICW